MEKGSNQNMNDEDNIASWDMLRKQNEQLGEGIHDKIILLMRKKAEDNIKPRLIVLSDDFFEWLMAYLGPRCHFVSGAIPLSRTIEFMGLRVESVESFPVLEVF